MTVGSAATRGTMLPVAQPTCFLIADISGYTSYLADVELERVEERRRRSRT